MMMPCARSTLAIHTEYIPVDACEYLQLDLQNDLRTPVVQDLSLHAQQCGGWQFAATTTMSTQCPHEWSCTCSTCAVVLHTCLCVSSRPQQLKTQLRLHPQRVCERTAGREALATHRTPFALLRAPGCFTASSLHITVELPCTEEYTSNSNCPDCVPHPILRFDANRNCAHSRFLGLALARRRRGVVGTKLGAAAERGGQLRASRDTLRWCRRRTRRLCSRGNNWRSRGLASRIRILASPLRRCLTSFDRS